MSQNPNVVPIDAAQVAKRVYDPTNDALRVDVGSPEFVISGGLVSASATITSTSSGVVIPAIACAGAQAFQVYIFANTITAGTVTARIDVSPDTSSSTTAWVSTSNTTSLGASSAGSIVAGTILTSYLPNQVRVSLTANGLTAGQTATVYIIGNTF